MPEPDAFDPTHALDGWRAPAPAPLDLQLRSLQQPDGHARGLGEAAAPRVTRAEPEAFDPTHALNGWHAPAPVPLDLRLKPVQRTGGPWPDEAKMARLKARGYEMVDVEDVELPDRWPAFDVLEASVAEVLEAPSYDAPEPEPLAEAPTLDVEATPPAAEQEPSVESELPEPHAEAVTPPEAPAPKAAELTDAPEPPGPSEPAVPPAEPALPHPPPATDVPVLDFHAAPPPTATDLQDLIGLIKLPTVEPRPSVVEAPVLDFHLAPAPAEPDPQRVLESIELPGAAFPPAAVDTPVLDMSALGPHAGRDPRLLARWQPLAWTVSVRRIADATTEVLQAPGALSVENHASQWLCALWSPQGGEAPRPGRSPDRVTVIGADEAADVMKQLLCELPADTPLWVTDGAADWPRIAGGLLQQAATLRPAQARALRELAGPAS